jgi:transcriptional regulator with XRE-family HTH domain
MSQSKDQAIEKGQLLKEFFKEKGITQQEAADALGILQTNVSSLLLGKRNFGRKMAEKWSQAFGIRVNWLITGEGPMFEGQEISDLPQPPAPSELDELIPIVPNGLTNISDSQPKVHQFPRYDFYFQCVTDAMRPEIYAGDLLGIRRLEPTAPLINGETYVFDTKSAGMQIRMLEEREDGYLATAHNDRYKETFFPRSEVLSIFTIVGLVRVK